MKWSQILVFIAHSELLFTYFISTITHVDNNLIIMNSNMHVLSYYKRPKLSFIFVLWWWCLVKDGSEISAKDETLLPLFNIFLIILRVTYYTFRKKFGTITSLIFYLFLFILFILTRRNILSFYDDLTKGMDDKSNFKKLFK